MEIILYIVLGILGLLLLLILISVIRALVMKRTCVSGANEPKPVDEQKKKHYAESLSKLIQIPSISVFKESDLTLFYQVHKALEELFPLVHSSMEKVDLNGSLLFKWKGKDSSKKGLLFMAHMDVVASNGDEFWTHPPFSGKIIDNKVWGRGTLDTKGLLFAYFQAAEELLKEGYVPSRDLYIASSIDEEIAGSGSPNTVQYLLNHQIELELVMDEGGTIIEDAFPGINSPFALIGVVEKGYADVKFTYHSKGGHSSTPSKNNSTAVIAAFMNEVNKKSPFKSKFNKPILEMFKSLSPNLPFSLRLLLGNTWLYGGIIKFLLPRVSSFGRAMLETTCVFTIMEGSKGYNVIPAKPFVVANLRFNIHQNRDTSLKLLKKIADKYHLEMEVLQARDVSNVVETSTTGYRFLASCIEEFYDHKIPHSPYLMTGGTDGRHYNKVTNANVRFGALRMSQKDVAKCHGLDEYIDITSLAECVQFYKFVMKKI